MDFMKIQAEMMQWFQNLFSGAYSFFDVLFIIITAFGEEIFIFILFPVFYWAVDKKASHLLAFAGFTSLTINGVIKDACKIPRPCNANHYNEMIRFVEADNFLVNTVDLKNGASYSFPSGHAQGISTLLFSLATYYKKTWLWITSVVAVVLVAASRIYLGVHWPMDVAVGAFLGLGFAVATYFAFKKAKTKTRNIIYLSFSALFLLLLFFAVKSDTFKAVGAFMGFSIGAILENKYVSFDPKAGTKTKKAIRIILGIILLLALRLGLKALFHLISTSYVFDFLRYFILVFFGVFLYPLIFKKIKL